MVWQGRDMVKLKYSQIYPLIHTFKYLHPSATVWQTFSSSKRYICIYVKYFIWWNYCNWGWKSMSNFCIWVSPLLLRPHCIQLRSQLPKGYLRIAKTTPTHQSNFNLNHTVQHSSFAEYYTLTGVNTITLFVIIPFVRSCVVIYCGNPFL